MSDEANESRVSPTNLGFQRWHKSSVDDQPLIRPPKHHMLAHMTGGLVSLYDNVKEDKATRPQPPTPSPPQSPSNQTSEETVDNNADSSSTKVDKDIDGEVDSKSDNKLDEDSEKEKCTDNDNDNENDNKCETNNDKEPDDDDNNDKDDDDDDVSDNNKTTKNCDKSKSDSGSGDEKDSVNGKCENEEKALNAVSTTESSEETGGDKDSGGKKDDEGGGTDEEKEKEKEKTEKKKKNTNPDSEEDEDEEVEDEEEEETTPYTDEEGEFSPESNMPLLAQRYRHLKVLARGQSALIIKAHDTFAKDRPVAIKVLHRVYKPIGSQEADILLELHHYDPWLHVPFARLQNQFLYGPHYCLVFEYLSPTPLYTHYDQRDIRDAKSLPHIRNLTVKLLTVMGFLYKHNVIHADLKPENILLRDDEDMASVMVVDFGNALRNTDEELSLYYSDFELQTLLYRAPEVIFGIKFSLEVDMWSLGCLIAECYLGEPLFIGKTRHDILVKITKLLGCFPKEFGEGEFAEEFEEFINRPLSRYQRVENLRKRLNDCKDINFLLLIEKMLTYSPARRVTPFDAACHPFVASVNPFLYLSSSPAFVRYPTVPLDVSTYPYLPEVPEPEEGQEEAEKGRKRLMSYANFKRVPRPAISSPLPEILSVESSPEKEKPEKESSGKNKNSSVNSKAANQSSNDKDKSSQKDTQKQLSLSSSEKENTPIQSGSKSAQQTKSHSGQNKDKIIAHQNEGSNSVSRTDVKETLKSMGLRCEDFTISVYSREQAHAILRKQGVEVTNHTPAPTRGNQAVIPVGTRGMPNQNVRYQPRGVKENSRSSVSVSRPDTGPPMKRQNSNMNSVVYNKNRPPPPPPPREEEDDDDDDDDDCVILDPPDVPVPKPIRAAPPRLPQQFQLMGTTVQVNRGAKRYMRNTNQPMAKRHNARGGHYYNNAKYMDDDTNAESSVQDTLKRLKNYNISITCRRNAQGGNKPQMPPHRMGGMHGGMSQAHHRHQPPMNMMHHLQGPRGQVIVEGDNEFEGDDGHIDSEEEEYLGNYLECEIGEDGEDYGGSREDLQPEEDFENFPGADVSVEEVPSSDNVDEEIDGETNDKKGRNIPENLDNEDDVDNVDDENDCNRIDDDNNDIEEQNIPSSNDEQLEDGENPADFLAENPADYLAEEDDNEAVEGEQDNPDNEEMSEFNENAALEGGEDQPADAVDDAADAAMDDINEKDEDGEVRNTKKDNINEQQEEEGGEDDRVNNDDEEEDFEGNVDPLPEEEQDIDEELENQLLEGAGSEVDGADDDDEEEEDEQNL